MAVALLRFMCKAKLCLATNVTFIIESGCDLSTYFFLPLAPYMKTVFVMCVFLIRVIHNKKSMNMSRVD